MNRLHTDARSIFDHAVQACSISSAMDRRLRFDGLDLVRGSSARASLAGCDHLLVIAMGKAAVPMTRALLERLPTGVPVRGVCAGALIPANADTRVQWFRCGHPFPTAESFTAAREALRLLREATARTFVFFLLSGGGSAMLELPLDPAISLEETLEFHRALVGSGATIAEINTVRKRFSAVKGGRLAMAAPDARQITLLLADVPLKDVTAVASSPTLPDATTNQQCREILEQYGLMAKFPGQVRRWFQHNISVSDSQPQTFATDYEVLLSNEDLVAAAAERAQSLGYHVVVDNACDDWEYREACRYLLDRFREWKDEFPRACLISGGEVTVRLEGQAGIGGRNQQFALAAAIEMAHKRNDCTVVLSAGSDGIDGDSHAAGAIADATTVLRARTAGLDPMAAFARFDSGTLFAALGDAVVTGPTETNLRDLRVLL